MTHGSAVAKYIIISPVKNESALIETTIKSIVAQTVRPSRWIIVDDASEDGTPAIIEAYAREHDWIDFFRRTHDGPRRPGGAVIRAFKVGYERIANRDYDFIVKLDCDLDLPKDYFERILREFDRDPGLGIASGVYLEQHLGLWLPIPMPSYHAAGASKIIRAKCFRDIGGFVESKGWDTVDEIRAQKLGWRTQHFPDVQFRHLKHEGVGIGLMRTAVMQGEVYYLTGGGKFFLLLKILHRMVGQRPLLLSGFALAWGFVRLWLRRTPKLVTTEEARLYARLLNGRVWANLTRVFMPFSRDEVAGS